MLQIFWLAIADARKRALIKTITEAGLLLGDSAAAPREARALFSPALNRLKELGRGADGFMQTEEFLIRLQNAFSAMALHDVASDTPITETLFILQRACLQFPKALSPFRGKWNALEIFRLCGSARKTLGLGTEALRSDSRNFPQNLKFSSIYAEFDSVIDALERCAQAIL